MWSQKRPSAGRSSSPCLTARWSFREGHLRLGSLLLLTGRHQWQDLDLPRPLGRREFKRGRSEHGRRIPLRQRHRVAGVAGLLLVKSYFGLLAFMGLISLAGIVINNAIVLLDRIKIEREEFNRPPQEAIIVAAQQRFRPILLTTATTSLGLIPLWVGGGTMWRPMAITIIFGLLFATIITLLFVPVLYKSFFRISYKNYKKTK